MKLFERHFGTGETVVILHGLFGQSDNWTSIARKLGEKYCVYTFDLRNHGQSGHSDEMNYRVMASDVLETIDGLGLDKIHLIGHSMGGKVAMLFGLTYPERLNSLVIADIGPRYYKPHHSDIITGLSNIDLSSLKSRQEAENQVLDFIPDFGTRQFLLKNLYRLGENQFAWRFNLPVISRTIENIGEAIDSGLCQIATLFYRGSTSSYIKPEDIPAILNQFPHAQFEVMQDAGHWLHAEKPVEFIETIENWISSQST
ncbi:MAG TPA: alpha/beta fold hydrolase [Flavobacteriales bacterium]|nr:alpha/beta fold hydrolase [Flavobacteriales bacterium]HPH82073.1 alpha/beta fold hydrolase [Flavobacteriales bacterium]